MKGEKNKVVIYKNGEVLGVIDSMLCAAHYVGINYTGVRKMVATGKRRDGYFVRLYNHETDSSLPNITPHKDPPIRKEYRCQGKPESIRDSDRKKYTIIHYEVRCLHICVTPCPFKQSPKPLVGSVNCIRCGSFKGRDKRTQEVCCTRKF